MIFEILIFPSLLPSISWSLSLCAPDGCEHVFTAGFPQVAVLEKTGGHGSVLSDCVYGVPGVCSAIPEENRLSVTGLISDVVEAVSEVHSNFVLKVKVYFGPKQRDRSS